MRVFRSAYTIARPVGAKILERQDGKWAQFTNERGKEIKGRLTKSGKRITLETRCWHIEFKDHEDILRQLKVDPDERTTQRVATTIQDLLGSKTGGSNVGQDLRRRLEELPTRIRKTLTAWGLLNEKASMATKPLSQLIAGYEEHLKARERTRLYIRNTISDVNTVCEACGFRFYSDIVAEKLEGWLKRHRDKDKGISFRRSNSILTAVKMFCNWAIECSYVSQSPVKTLKPLNVREDRRRIRRAIEVDDLKRLLTTTRNSPTRHGLTGYERYLLYRLASETGLRRGELSTLKVTAFHWDTLTLQLAAKLTKNRKADVLPLRPDTAAELQEYVKAKLPTATMFSGMPDDTAEMLRDDLADAGIPYKDEAGQVFDFHALRGECGTLLAAAGVHPKTAQTIMRHSDINLTMGLYTHTLRGQEAQAVAALPDLSSDQQQDTTKTGTDDQPEILRNSYVPDGNNRTALNSIERPEPTQPHSDAASAGTERIMNPLLHAVGTHEWPPCQ
jgi:integrase